MPNATLNKIIDYFGKKESVDPALVKAVIRQESNFIPTAYRFEPHLREASYGLMQTLESTARLLGFTGDPIRLFNPSLSIKYGTEYLRDLMAKFGGNIKDTLSGYNGGPGSVRRGGPYHNQSYVDSVYKYYQYYKTQDILKTMLPVLGVAIFAYFFLERGPRNELTE